MTISTALDRLTKGDTSREALMRDMGAMMFEGLVSRGFARALEGTEHYEITLAGAKYLLDLEGIKHD